ncbi:MULTISPECIES: hypothetical protein [Streptomyces]|nr:MULTISPECIES: hypothetical protein [Streptomyces]
MAAQEQDERRVPSPVLYGRACRYCHRLLDGSSQDAGTITDARIYGHPYPIPVRACAPGCPPPAPS